MKQNADRPKLMLNCCGFIFQSCRSKERTEVLILSPHRSCSKLGLSCLKRTKVERFSAKADRRMDRKPNLETMGAGFASYEERKA